MGLKLRRGTAAAATAANVTLEPFEEGWETNTDLGKLGDGVTAWNDLPYTLRKTFVGTATELAAVETLLGSIVHNWVWIDTT